MFEEKPFEQFSSTELYNIALDKVSNSRIKAMVFKHPSCLKGFAWARIAVHSEENLIAVFSNPEIVQQLNFEQIRAIAIQKMTACHSILECNQSNHFLTSQQQQELEKLLHALDGMRNYPSAMSSR